jgi:hypothetical protein
MGAKGAAEDHLPLRYRRPGQDRPRTKEYEDRFLSPFVAAERGYLDEVITPRTTRKQLARGLATLRGLGHGSPAITLKVNAHLLHQDDSKGRGSHQCGLGRLAQSLIIGVPAVAIGWHCLLLFLGGRG